MIEQAVIEHRIQKHIIGVLIHNKNARFRDLRPPKTDTNLFSYHLKILLKTGFITKQTDGYTLSHQGLVYADRVSIKKLNLRTQPKIISMLLIQNSEGDVLLQKRKKQPYINTWTLPYGKIHIDDRTIQKAAKREAREKLAITTDSLRHAGDAYIRVYVGDEILSTTLAHVFRYETDTLTASEDLVWVAPLELASLPLAPAVESVVARCFFGDSYFFVEFDEQWQAA
jgi:ADP-ribose pyrophosphatase YjhB (NUDIX family)